MDREHAALASLVVKLPIEFAGDDGNAEELLASKHQRELVVQQYYTSLLESIGVRATEGPARQLAQHIGLSASSVKAHARVIGSVLQVAAAAPSPPPVPGLPASQLQAFGALQPLVVGGSAACSTQDGALTAAAARQEKERLFTFQQQDDGADQHSFVHQVQQHSYPFSAKRSLNKQPPAIQRAAAAAAAAVKHLATASNLQQHKRELELPSSKQLTPEVLLELAQDFVVLPAAVGAAQASFAQGMCAELTGPRAADLCRCGRAADVAALGQLLVAPKMVRLAVTLLNYCYCRFVVECPELPRELTHHLRATSLACGHTKNFQLAVKQRRSVLVAPAAPGPQAQQHEPEKWDLGMQLLLQRKAQQAAARHLHEAAAKAAANACQASAACACSGNSGAALLSAEPSSSRSIGGRPADMALKHQDSSCSRSSSFAGSVSNYKQQQMLAAQQAATLSAADLHELQGCRLSAVLQQFDELKQELSRSSQGATFALPVILLSLQALADSLFSSHFPAWQRCTHGWRRIAAITAAVAQLLDPQGCYRTLLVMAGSPAAAAARQRHDTGPAAAARRRRSMQGGLGSVVSVAVGAQPASVGVRRMLATQSGGSNHQQQRRTAFGPQPAAAADLPPAAELPREPVHVAAASKLKPGNRSL